MKFRVNYLTPVTYKTSHLCIPAPYPTLFVGYQDMLYTHSLRQFYHDCDVYDIVNFVFDDVVIVLQNCNHYTHMPNTNQKNVFTVQGR
jgi:pectin methylesterase-like acyl-CoA thioesterase